MRLFLLSGGLLTICVVFCFADKELPLRHSPTSVFSTSLDSHKTEGSSSSISQGSLISSNGAYGGSSSSIGGELNSGSGKSFIPFSSSGEFGGNAEASGGAYPSSLQYPTSSSQSQGGYHHSPQSQSAAGGSASSISSEHSTQGVGGTHGANQGAYTYYYQHYPQAGGSVPGSGWGQQQQQGGGVHSDLGGDDFGGEGGAGLGGIGGLAGIGGLKGLGIIAAAAKGIIALKPFLILGLLFLIAIPVLLLFLPIPIITITGSPGGGIPVGGRRSARSTTQQILHYITSLTGKVLSAEECLERMLCKLPQPEEKVAKKAKSLWEEWVLNSGLIKNERLSRGLKAYFDNPLEAKNKAFKCNQRFQCSNKYL